MEGSIEDDGEDSPDNYWTDSPVLQAEAERAYGGEDFAWAQDRLELIGELAAGVIDDNAAEVDRQGHELWTYDRDGNVQNHVEYHPRQLENDELAYGNGLVADVFDAPEGSEDPLGAAHALTMQTLLAGSDSGFVCPVSMTTGAAIALDLYGNDEYADEYLDALTTREMDEHIEGAMFLTEKQGGSDVGANETTAEPTDEEGVYELYGEKWFCSNIDAEGTLALARRPEAPEGTDGLSMFIVPHTKPNGKLNDQVYRRLKDKLGTIAVPTGEVVFEGAEAYLVGEPEQGFKYMAEMMNFERLTNATGSVGIMARALMECKQHAASRDAFGETIDQYPLMRRDLVDMQVDYEAGAAFTFEAVRWYDRYLRGKAEDEHKLRDDEIDDEEQAHKLMRLFVPIAKYKLARECVDTASYACEVRGGDGYVNGFVTERLLRDAQVTPIWEGTSNILSLDVLRVLGTENAHEALIPFVSERLDAIEDSNLEDLAETVRTEFESLQQAMFTLASADRDYAQHEAKQLADYIYDVVTAILLLERAQDAITGNEDARKALVARWFVRTRFEQPDARGITDESALPDQYYEEIVRHAPLDPADLDEQSVPAADD
jgi:acyl-CoA dehydrogenase